jgi:hypothetical protein
MKNIETFESKVKLPGLVLPVRSILLSLSSAKILVSPIDFSEAQRKSLMGVTDIVAPTLTHHLFVLQAKEIFPEARLWGALGFQNKRPDIPWNKEITNENWLFSDELEILSLQGMPTLNEVVFFHKTSKSLLVADLCFNLVSPEGWLAPILLRAFGTYKRFNISRMLLSYVKDKDQFRQSMRQLMQWNFENIIMAHGELVLGGAKEKLAQALRSRNLL